MSTAVDKNASKPARSSGAQTRARVLEAARRAFSHAGFDHVGVREIAADAITDPAVVIRLFGSKEALFAEVAAGAFGLEPAFEGSMSTLGAQIAAYLVAPLEADAPQGFDEFQFLLRSAASPTAAPLLSASLHADFIGPLARRLGGAEAEARAALITAYVLGFATLRVALGSPAIEGGDRSLIARQLGAAIQTLVDL